jgi:hypothetical protein
LENVVSCDVTIAQLEADLSRLKTLKTTFVEQRARTWSRWGTEPFIELTGQRLAELDRQMDELARRASAVRAGRTI